MNDGVSHMTLDMPASWDSFGQWVIYAIVLGMVIAVLIIMFKILFPKNESEDETKSD